jgi:virginiamycin B lyase
MPGLGLLLLLRQTHFAAHKAKNGQQGENAMKIKHWLLVTTAAMAVSMLAGFDGSRVAAQSVAVLAGDVTSAEEGAMEGVVVSAKKAGSTVTISVISDEKGHFVFPSAKLDPGQYTLRIRAIGYELDGPKTVDVGGPSAVATPINLRKARNLSSQLTSGEWFMSFPGSAQQKMFMDRCTSCHTYERIAKSTYNADEWIAVLQRMGTYAPGTTPLEPQKRKETRAEMSPERLRPRAEYLASINLSESQQWEYPLKTLPRLKGRSTKVVITEYDLPRATAMPHDVILDEQGVAWYTDFGHQFLGKLDPKSGKVTEYTVPTLKADYPPGMLDLHLDKKGDIWVGLMLQAGIAKFDRKAEKFTMYPLPQDINNPAAQQAMVMPLSADVDGKVWMNSVGIPGVHRMELATQKFETFAPFADFPKNQEHSVYGIKADSQNNLYFMDFSADLVGRIDAKTGKYSFFKTPTPNSNPRRGWVDPQDRLWFTEYRADRLAMFDTKTERFTEWQVPTPYSWPYDVMPDKNGELWTAGMSTDRVTRLDPKTGQAVEYQLPKSTNVRRVFVDNTTTPVTFWVGSNHGASIVKVEPLD